MNNAKPLSDELPPWGVQDIPRVLAEPLVDLVITIDEFLHDVGPEKTLGVLTHSLACRLLSDRQHAITVLREALDCVLSIVKEKE